MEGLRAETHDLFHSTADAVNSALIPQRRLYTEALMRAIGLGTFGSNDASADVVADAVCGPSNRAAPTPNHIFTIDS